MTFSVFVVYSSDYDDIVLFSRTMRWWGCGWETSGLRSTVFCLYRPATTCLPSPTWHLRYSSTYSPHRTPFNIPNPFPIQLPPHPIISKWHPRYSSTSPPHSVQHSLPHLSLTPFNIPSSTHLPLQPHPTILKITPQVQFYFLTPTQPHPMVTCSSSTTRCHR